MKTTKNIGSLCLILAALIWGFSFVCQNLGLDLLSPIELSMCCTFLACISLTCVRWLKSKRNHESFRLLPPPNALLKGSYCGMVLAFSTLLQQFGIQRTTVGNAGFITVLYILLVPIIKILLGSKPKPIIWIAATAGTVGLLMLCGVEGGAINSGDLLVLCSTLGFALHIIIVEKFTSDMDVIDLTFIQELIIFIVCVLITALCGFPEFSKIIGAIFAILYIGILSNAGANLLQIFGQSMTEASEASLYMSLESVFAALGGFIFLHERMSLTEFLGCLLMFGAITLVQLPEGFLKNKKIKRR